MKVSNIGAAAAAAEAPSGNCAYDVFNGDADGICALHQLRLAFPKAAQRITGVKRDIELLRRVPLDDAAEVTVLDVSLDVNAASLHRLLDAGAQVTYVDHHSARKAFAHPRLQLIWDDAPDVCTSILVDRLLDGRFRPWAVTAAFGDGLPAAGLALARLAGLDDRSIPMLEELGQLLNYNAYGECVEDLLIPPDALYLAIRPFVDPVDFIAGSPEYGRLLDGFRSDSARMDGVMPHFETAGGAVYVLPGQPWARRISGVFANKLVAGTPARSFAVLTEKADGTYVVSVRSGHAVSRDASLLCERFPTGGGRKAAAGINALPASEVVRFVESFAEYFATTAMPAAGHERHAV